MPDDLIGEGDVVKGYYSKLERRTQILRYLSDGKIRSTSEIAKALKMQNSTNLRKMLLELWHEKHLLAYTESRMYRWQKPLLEQLELFTV
jgi:DNA-binding IclR family transcriptional regulator